MVGPTQQISEGSFVSTGVPATPAPATPAPAAPVRPELPPPQAQPPPEPVEPIVDAESLVDKVVSIGKLLRGINNRLDFSVHESTSQLVVQVVDRQTGKLVRTMPPEEFLELKDRIDASVGLLLDEQA